MLNIKVPERKKHMSLSFAARVVYNSKKFTQPLVMGYSANGVSGVREKKCSRKSNLHMQHLIFICRVIDGFKENSTVALNGNELLRRKSGMIS